MELFKLLGIISIENNEANNAIDQTADKAEESESKMSEAFKKVGKAIAGAFAIDKIKDFGLSCVEAAANVKATNSQFEQVFADLQDKASSSLSKIADDTGIIESRMKGSYTQIAAFAKTTGMDTADSLDLANRSMVAVADSAAYYDRSLEETTESLQSFLKGNYENDAALGLSCTETTRNAEANKLYGKSFNDLSESQKQLTLLSMVEEANKLSGAMGQAARESDGWENVTGNLNEAWKNFQATIGAPVLEKVVPIIQKATDGLSALGEKAGEVIEWTKEHESVVTVLGAAIVALTAAVVAYKGAMAIASLIQGVSKAMEGMTLAQAALNAVMSLNPIGIIVGLLAALVAAFVVLWNKSDAFREFWISIWEGIKEFAEIAVDGIKAAIEKLKQFFDSLANKLQDIWDTIVNVIDVAIQLIVEIVTLAFDLITLPFQLIWENCKDTVKSVWDSISDWLSKKFDAISSKIDKVWTAISDFLGRIWDTISNTVKNKVETVKNTVESVFNKIKSVATEIWNAIKSKIDEAVGDIKSTVSNGFNAVKSKIDGILDGIKNKFSSVFDGIKSYVSGVIDWLKGIFHFDWDLPKIKLPHFNVSGKFSLDPPSTPKFDIEWYKQGGIMTEPTAFGINPKNGKMMVGGEAGAEAIAPIDTLKQYIADAVTSSNRNMVSDILNGLAGLGVGAANIPEKIVMQVQLDRKTIAEATYSYTAQRGNKLVGV